MGKIKGPKGFFADSVKAFMDSSWMECVVKFLANTINNMPNGEDKDEYLKRELCVCGHVIPIVHGVHLLFPHIYFFIYYVH